jgi:FAD/FMN-containing dehydrogenase
MIPSMDVASLAEHFRALDIETLTDDLEPYGRDETMDLFAAPQLVVRPRSTPDVVEVLRVASEEAIPVTPRGGGTGKAGGCIPVRGGIVLSLDRMNKIREIDVAKPFAGVEAGVVLWTQPEECARHGLL